MASKKKVASAVSPLTGEIVNVPATKRGAKPTMKEPEGTNTQLASDVQTSGIAIPSKIDLIKLDIDQGLAIADRYMADLAQSRVGPDGIWTRLVEGHVYTLADWTGIRDTFKVTLWKTVQERVKRENPMPEGTDESLWLASVNAMADATVKQPVYAVLASQFNIIGRFFQKRGEEPPVGRERLLQILKGETLAKPAKNGAIPWAPVLKELQSVAPASTRGRKRGTTNKDNDAKKGIAPGLPQTQVTPQEVVTDPAIVQKQVRESTMRACLEYIDKLATDREYLIPVMLALANKLKASGDENLQDVGLLMIDSAQAGSVPDEEEEEEEEEVTPKIREVFRGGKI